jgi:GT2 family glycosyltransferase
MKPGTKKQTRPSSKGLPCLSVIVLVDRQRRRGEACLQSILAQSRVDDMEVLLLDFAPEGTPPLRASRHPAVRRLKLDYKTGYGQARGLAVRTARAPVVAFVEEHVRVRPGWAEAMLRSHEEGWAGVGPEVHNPTPGLGRSDLVFLTGFGEWVPPLAPGESRLIPGQNSAFKRGALLRYDRDLDRLLEADIFLQWRLRADGWRLYHDPEARIEHSSEGNLRTLMRGYYLVMRHFAPLRAEIYQWSPARRALRLLLVPAGPLVRTARLVWALARRRSPYLGKALAGVWAVFGAHLGGAAGEAVGLLAGVPTHDRRFLAYEMNAPRAGWFPESD